MFTPVISLGNTASSGVFTKGEKQLENVIVKLSDDYADIFEDLTNKVLMIDVDTALELKRDLEPIDRMLFEDILHKIKKIKGSPRWKDSFLNMLNNVLLFFDAIDVVLDDEPVDESSDDYQDFLKEFIMRKKQTEGDELSQKTFYDFMQISNTQN